MARDWTGAEVKRAQDLAREGLSPDAIAAKLGRSTGTCVREALRYNGPCYLELRNQGLDAKVKPLLEVEELTAAEIAAKLGWDQRVIRKSSRRLGIDLRDRADRMRNADKVNERHASWARRRVGGEGTASIAADEGVTHEAVRQALRRVERLWNCKLSRPRPMAAK